MVAWPPIFFPQPPFWAVFYNKNQIDKYKINKKYEKIFDRLRDGGVVGIVCFLVADLSSLFSPNIQYYLLVSLILAIASIAIYLNTKIYKINHKKILTIGLVLFICAMVVVYFCAFYLTLAISFATSHPTIF